MKKCLVTLLLLGNSILLLAQIGPPIPTGPFTPGGRYDSLYDNSGNKIALSDNVVDPHFLITCSSGYFQLFYEPGCGMAGNTPAEVDRRNVLCQLFSDISSFIIPPPGSPLQTVATNYF